MRKKKSICCVWFNSIFYFFIRITCKAFIHISRVTKQIYISQLAEDKITKKNLMIETQTLTKQFNLAISIKMTAIYIKTNYLKQFIFTASGY